MDFACTSQVYYGWMVPQMDSLMLPGAAGLTGRESQSVMYHSICGTESADFGH